MKKAYDIITDQIIAKLKEGEIPWHKPWKSLDEMPTNLVSKKAYRGINILLLGMTGHSSPYWMTYKQAKQLGGSVKKGEKGTMVVFWKIPKKENEDGGTDNIPLLRHYTVFNLDQCKDIDESKIPQADHEPREFSEIEECENIVKSWISCPEIKHNEARAYYSPVLDYINMPKHELFESDEEYYSTLFHEMVHSTGHKNRLNRAGLNTPTMFGSEDYSKEELVAEMGAAYLCGHAGIQNRVIDNSAAYIKGWLSKLEDDNKILVHAAGAAQRAVDFILGIKFENKGGDK